MTIIHFYPNFDNIGGAQSMVLTIYNGMKLNSRDVKVSGFTSYNNINSRYKKDLPKSDYIKLNILKFFTFKNRILISHHRKITTYLLLLSNIFFLRYKLIHVAHNEFYNLKLLTLYPKHIIAVSNRVKMNLSKEFNISSSSIKVIYNGINNDYVVNLDLNKKKKQTINILYPARVNSVKKQIELVKYIKEKDIKNISIRFCGDGDLLEDLKVETKNDKRFDVKGLVDNMQKEFNSSDYTLLFTTKEGLPVSLIESCKYGKPIICNDVGGNLEIVKDQYNGFVVNSYDELAQTFFELQNLNDIKYLELCSNSRKQFIDKFTQSKMVSQYLCTIDEFTIK